METRGEKNPQLIKVAKAIYEKAGFMKNQLFYAQESIKNRYPCSIFKSKKINGEYVIYYCILGKKDNIHRVSVNDLLNDKLLLEKFHPIEAAIVGFIAGGNTLIKLSQDEQEETFKMILANMLGEE